MIGKTWLTALFCVVRCILFPKTKICVASATRSQANEVLSKIVDDFMKNYNEGSENLRREIKNFSIGYNLAYINFHNGSWIKVVTGGDNARGNRANVLVLDEFRMLDKDTIDTVLKRFLGSPRQPAYLSKKEYQGKPELLETNIEIYMSSCWFESHWSYKKSKAFTFNLLGGRTGYFVCALPYQIAIKEGLKKRIEIEDEMSEEDFDERMFQMEMGCLPIRDTDGSFFTFNDISRRRKIKTAFYTNRTIMSKRSKLPDLAPDERRILSIDIALMASKHKNSNDASSIIINSAKPNGKRYIANIVYLENVEGMTTDDLALKIRRLFSIFDCTDLVIDTAGTGLGVYDMLIKDIIDPETGEIYPALSCCNNKAMEERCKVADAPKVIWSIKGTVQFNNDICVMLRNAFTSSKINLLLNESEAEKELKATIKNFEKLTPEEQLMYKMPYIQTSLLVYELINLQYEVKGTNIRIKEKSGMRKDRYSSLAYNYYVMTQLESKLDDEEDEFDAMVYAAALAKMSHKAKLY